MSNQDLNKRNDLLARLNRSNLNRIKLNSHPILEKNQWYFVKSFYFPSKSEANPKVSVALKYLFIFILFIL